MRHCRQALARDQQRLVCPQKHSFDLARSGYINLLQPQERRSKQPGDTVAAVAARRRLHDQGVTAPLLDGLAAFLGATANDRVLDAGCGDGFYLGSLARQFQCEASGVISPCPLSKPPLAATRSASGL